MQQYNIENQVKLQLLHFFLLECYSAESVFCLLTSESKTNPTHVLTYISLQNIEQ